MSTNGNDLKLPIYMDNQATTRCDPRVLEAMLPHFTETYGNAASRNHEFGWTAEQTVAEARGHVAKLIGSTSKEIIFTSGATESDNLAIKGVAEMYREKGNHIITQTTEHKAVLDSCKGLENRGFRVTYLPVQKDGRISLDELKAAMDDQTILVTIMTANNEIGVLQPIREIGTICHERGVLFHTDAVQAVGKVPFNVNEDLVDLASISAHKVYGPKGVGALYVRRKNPRVQLVAQIDGGGHENGMRSGTLNVTGIVGLSKACEIARAEMPEESVRLTALRDRLKDGIMSQVDECYINGSLEHRLPGNINISFAHVKGESLLMAINDVALSSGSACTSAAPEPSYVMKALGVGPELGNCSIRFGIGRFNTEAEVDHVIKRIVDTVQQLRESSPHEEMAEEGMELKEV
jgi:cysteine desulfurase